MTFFLNVLLNGLTIGLLYALCAFGFALVLKHTGVANLAQGQFAAVGAFLFSFLLAKAGLPFSLALAATWLSGFMLGLVYERLLFRRLAGKKLKEAVVLTIGLAMVLEGLLNFAPAASRSAHAGLYPAYLSFAWRGVEAPSVYSAALIMGVLFFVLFGLFSKYSSKGVYMRSASENAPAALSLGVSVKRISSLSWAIGASAAAAGGSLIGAIQGAGAKDPAAVGLMVFPVALLGGLDSLGGVIFGGILIGLTEAFAAAYFSASLGETAPFAFIFLVLLTRPRGLFGSTEAP